MTMAGDTGKIIFQSSRVISPVPAQLSERSVRSENRGSCSLSGVTAENSSFQCVIGTENKILVPGGKY